MTATCPYLVTHTRVPEHDGATGYVLYREYVLYRRPFATLEEAKEIVGKLAWPSFTSGGPNGRKWSRCRASIIVLPESGGTISLPDGSVIEVEATTYGALYLDLPKIRRPHGLTLQVEANRQVLAAWNAEHGIGSEVTR